MNGYELSRKFVDFSFENPSKIKPNHYALYFFAIEHCNRLGWKREFGLATTMTMEAIGIKSYNTYINTFEELEKFGFFNVIQRSKNQYSSNIIELSNFNKALYKALDKAFIKHATKQSESTQQSIDSINKPITNKPINNKQENKEVIAFDLVNTEQTQKLEIFLMQNKLKCKDWDSLVEAFNNKVELELAQDKIQFDSEVLFPRFKMFFNSWVNNQKPSKDEKPKIENPNNERIVVYSSNIDLSKSRKPESQFLKMQINMAGGGYIYKIHGYE